MRDSSSLSLNLVENALNKPSVSVLLEHGTPSILVDIEGMSRHLILDTGSNISILQPGISRHDIEVMSLKPCGVTGKVLNIKGRQSVSFEFDECRFEHEFLVCSLPTAGAGLLGTDWMAKAGAIIDFDYGKMIFRGNPSVSTVCNATLTGHNALTIFMQGKEGRSLQPAQRETMQLEEQPSASSQHMQHNKQDGEWLVRATENIVLPPRSRQIVKGKLDSEKGLKPRPLICIKPALIPIEGILPARVLSRVESHTCEPISAMSSDVFSATQAPSSNAYVMLANFSSETLTMPKASVLGLAEEVSELLVNKVNSDRQIEPRKRERNEALYQKLLRGKLDHLSRKERQLIEPVLRKYAHVFHDEETNDFKGTHVIEHEIPVGNARRPCRTPYTLRDEMKTQVESMLQKGVIRESNSPWAALAILVPKKRGPDGKQKFRFCVDFRALNSITKFDSYPLPVFEEATASLSGSKYSTVLDCYSGFWQVPIKEEHKERTAFTVPSEHYKFNRLPFGLSNSLSNFQRLMDVVLRNLVGTECFVFIDDLVIYSKTPEEHTLRLGNVLQRLEKANLQMHPGKCAFAQPKVQYLGYVLSESGVSASPNKVSAVKHYPTPKCVKEVRAFLGLAGFYRQLVPDFAEITKPLTQLTCKNQEFVWGTDQQKAFEKMKDRLSMTPVLAYPNFELPFILMTDVSKTAVAAILSQLTGRDRATHCVGKLSVECS
jgi:hypothetical protein